MVYDEGSAGPGEIAAAARGAGADVFLVVDRAAPHVARLAPALGRRFELLDITGLTPEAAAAQVCARAPEGLLTFSEHRMAATSELAAAAGVKRWHTPETTRLLTDKYLQRRALADTGVDTTPCVPVPVGGAARAVAEVGLPAVLKPRQGTGSRHVRPVRTVEEAVAAAAEYHRFGPQGTDLLAERLLAGDPGPAGSPWGDYVSVETAVRDGDCRPVCVTGKFPLAEPFRERGSFVPHTLDDRTATRVTTLAEAAIGALGIRDGVVHTEIKLTVHGPRVIEVNGRVGGLVADLLRRGAGYDLV
ncbi:MAG: ATP-grasp domain-containing protein, partial [Solirubrobacterales bacterium]